MTGAGGNKENIYIIKDIIYTYSYIIYIVEIKRNTEKKDFFDFCVCEIESQGKSRKREKKKGGRDRERKREGQRGKYI